MRSSLLGGVWDFIRRTSRVDVMHEDGHFGPPTLRWYANAARVGLVLEARRARDWIAQRIDPEARRKRRQWQGRIVEVWAPDDHPNYDNEHERTQESVCANIPPEYKDSQSSTLGGIFNGNHD